ncbi:MAG: ribosome maturation factor RimM [Campylobacter sp.]|nr:ribosome maturation factor RimM [Campylobacter sp.]
MNDQTLLEVALLGKTVGLKGYVKLHNRSDFSEQFKPGACFYDKDGKAYKIKHYDKNKAEILLEGYEDIELAKALTNTTLYATVQDTRKTCKLKKDEFFYFDIIGLKVLENGEILGVVEDIEEIAGKSYFWIKVDEKLTNLGFAKNFYLPYLDNFVSKIDTKTGEISAINAKAILENS